MKISPGIAISFLGLLLLFISLMNTDSSMIEKAILTILFSLLVAFGVFLEKNYFPDMIEEFNEERKF